MTFTSKRLALLLPFLLVGVGLLAGGALLPSLFVAPAQAARVPALTGSGMALPGEVVAQTVTDSWALTSTVEMTLSDGITVTTSADGKIILVTEADIAKAVAGGAGKDEGATVENLQVKFVDGKMHVTADKVSYGILNMANLEMVGHLEAKDGKLSLQVDSISPRGLVAALGPKMANQALAEYGSEWYVEDVRIVEGSLQLRIK